MKKFALGCLVLALAVMIVPQSFAAQKCIHFTNFCDSISLNTATVGGVMGTAGYGGWDWLCTGNWTDASVLGNATNNARIGTRAYSAVYAYLSPYTFQFTFNLANGFDLYGTNGSSLFAFQTNQPFTLSGGACRTPAKNGMPRSATK